MAYCNDVPTDDQMLAAALLWSPMLLSERRVLGLVHWRSSLWVPVGVKSDRVGVRSVELHPLVEFGMVAMEMTLHQPRPARRILVALDLSASLRVI